ncbi:MAG TPA: DUF3048 domain-containing protein, partial [Anaerolineales bacterium]|nr:DUF3048 domain-containing protein [Anaerolineales bacterium]
LEAQLIVSSENLPPDTNPLTGLQVADPSVLDRRPVAIKVTNFPRHVRPQWGLSLADHVFEYYLEDLITRFIAVFYGNNAERVGPVRSGRFFDEHIVRMYKSFFVFAWADDRVVDPWTESDLRNFLVVERGDNCPPLCRFGPAYDYNTLFVDTLALEESIAAGRTSNNRQDLSGLSFGSVPPYSPQAGEQVYVRFSDFSYNRWDFDPASRRYLRYEDTLDAYRVPPVYAALTDSLTGLPIAADNLVILLVRHDYFANTPTTEMVTMNLLGEGAAYALRDGRIYAARWERLAATDLLRLTYPDGSPYLLKPGNVWYEVLGESSTMIQDSVSKTWQFDFAIP